MEEDLDPGSEGREQESLGPERKEGDLGPEREEVQDTIAKPGAC